MKTTKETLASLLAAIVWADGEYSEAEEITANEIAKAFGFSTDDIQKDIKKAIEEIKGYNETEVTDFIAKNAAEVDTEELGPVFEAMMQMALSDGELSLSEVHNILAIADALDIDTPTAVLLLCDLVKDEPEMQISFEEE